jgi:chorismate dehydratase
MRYGLEPEYVQGLAAEDGDDACLLIGDLALEETERGRFEFTYDLGSLWQEWQGLPFVFGAWVISKTAAQENRASLERYMDLTEKSIANFRADVGAALDRWLAHYPVSLPRHVVEDYYRVLDYRFTEERKRSLLLFLSLAARIGLSAPVSQLEFL